MPLPQPPLSEELARLKAELQEVKAERDRLRSEARLRDEERFRQVAAAADLGVWYCDLPFDEFIWDEGVRRHFGFAADKRVTLEVFYDGLHPDDRERTRQAIDTSIANDAPYDIEYRTVREIQGDVRWIRALGSTTYDKSGKPCRFDGITFDITEQKRLKAMVQESEAYFRTLVDSSPAMIWMTRPDGYCTYLSRRWAEYTGRNPEDDHGLGWVNAVHPDDREMARAVFLGANTSNQPFNVTYRLRRRDGVYRWAIDLADPRFDEHGVFLGYVGMVIDVHEAKSSEEYLSNLVGAIPHMIWAADENGQVFMNNTTYSEYCGLSDDALRGEGWWQVVHPDDRPAVKTVRKRAIPLREQYSVEQRIRRADGEYRWHLVRAVPREDATGKTTWFGTNTDIHGLKLIQEELYRSNTELARFAYVASHDLKEPIRVISNYAQLLQRLHREKLGTEGEKFIGFIVDNVSRMYSLINGLLGYSQIGAHTSELTAVDLNEVMGVVLTNLEASIRDTRARVEVSHLPSVVGDRTQMIQLLQNLVSNAVKYRSEQPPVVEVSALNQGTMQLISVRDNGIGIEPIYFEKIFGLFERLHSRSEYSGTGIGLAVCKKIVERHLGRIWVESVPGQGSTFHFTLPTCV